MVIHRAIELASPGHEFIHWLRHLGGPGLIILGIIDSSVIPIPGSMDAATILLSAHDKKLWPYFALMATIGSVIGGYLTYHIARRQGKNALEKRFSRRRITKITKTFEKWGFGAVLVPAILPPPAPMVPFLIAAGTSFAFPDPKPTRPWPSPTTTRALKLKFLPPLTTFVTRLMWTTLSIIPLSDLSSPRRSPRCD